VNARRRSPSRFRNKATAAQSRRGLVRERYRPTAPRIQLDAQRTLYHFEMMHVRYRPNEYI
jgi:hypothetical protein